MKSAENKTTAARSAQTQEQTRQPFFKKDGQRDFFSETSQAGEPFFSPQTIQPKLTIGKPGDKYEQEADSMADKVVQRLAQSPAPDAEPSTVYRLPSTVSQVQRKAIFESNEDLPAADVQTKLSGAPPVQAKCATCEQEEQLQKMEEPGAEEEPDVQAKCAACAEEEPDVQAKSDTSSPDATPGLQTRLNSSKGGGQSLPAATRSSMESAFGADFSGVRVHTGSEAVQMSQELGAQAFTHGSDIYFNSGKYDTGSTGGKKLLAHELTHTVQQGGGTNGKIQRDTKTTEKGPEQVEASLPAFPKREPHEVIIMSGGPMSNKQDAEHDDNPLNYATAARVRIERLMESAFGNQKLMTPQDRITWVVMSPPYQYRALEDGEPRDSYIDKIKNVSITKLQDKWNALVYKTLVQEISDESTKSGKPMPSKFSDIYSLLISKYRKGEHQAGTNAIRLQFVDSTKDFIDIMNNGATEGERKQLKIGRLEYFGHGVPGQLWFTHGWRHLKIIDESLTIDDINKLDPNAFIPMGEYRSMSCNTSTPPGLNKTSLAEAWINKVGGRFVGAVGRTDYAFILDKDLSKAKVTLSEGIYPLTADDRRKAPGVTPRKAYWTTTTGERKKEGEKQKSVPEKKKVSGWVHESELPKDASTDVQNSGKQENSPVDFSRIESDASSSIAKKSPPYFKPEEQVCTARVIESVNSKAPGDLVCSPDGSAKISVEKCKPNQSKSPQNTGTKITSKGNEGTANKKSTPDKDSEPYPGKGYLKVKSVDVNPNVKVAPDGTNKSWQPFLQKVGESALEESLEADDIPNTLYNLYGIGKEVKANSKGFKIGVVTRNGKKYYKIFGPKGAHAGIEGRWYAAKNFPKNNLELAKLVDPRTGLGQGLKSGSIGIGGALTVVGTTMDYAIDPKKEFGTDYAVDLSLDLVKSAGSSAAGGAAGAAATGWLAGGVLGAEIGSVAPVVGTIIGFVVGVLAAMAIEYFISDYRAAIKAKFHRRQSNYTGKSKKARSTSK